MRECQNKKLIDLMGVEPTTNSVLTNYATDTPQVLFFFT